MTCILKNKMSRLPFSSHQRRHNLNRTPFQSPLYPKHPRTTQMNSQAPPIHTIPNIPNLSNDDGREHLLCNSSTPLEPIPIIMGGNGPAKSGDLLLGNGAREESNNSSKELNLHFPHCLGRDEVGNKSISQSHVDCNNASQAYDHTHPSAPILPIFYLGKPLVQSSADLPNTPT